MEAGEKERESSEEKKIMVYVYYHRESEGVEVTTNLRRVAELSGEKYHTLRAVLSNGSGKIETVDYIIFKTELTKGKQTAPQRKEPMQSSQGPATEPEDSGDFFDKLLSDV